MVSRESFLKYFSKFPFFLYLFITSTINIAAQSDWFERDSEHFKVIYRSSHQHLVPHIINSAEGAYKILSKLFKDEPSTPIIINTYDINDYGFGAATSIPENFIRLEIEPFEPGYENTPYNDRFQWVLSHELVHIFVNDDASDFEEVQRKLFGKVLPLQNQPLTLLYSVSGNSNRYTPRWHQEALAVYLETWLSGGFGRILGNFDEMYFRTMVVDSVTFPAQIEIETILSHNSFLLEHLFYLYGGRFAAYLSITFGSEKLLLWFKSDPGDFFTGFRSKFNDIFNVEFDEVWVSFIEYEKKFQLENIKRIETSPVTELCYLSENSLGWVTQPYILPQNAGVVFGNHNSHNLAGIQILNPGSEILKNLTSLPSPSMFQVASTAFDSSTGLFFYTTNNNQLYRDLWVLDISSGETKLLFPDSRVGQLAVAANSRELWGIQHWSGKAALVYSNYPYTNLYHIKDFAVGDEVLNLAVSSSGKELAAVIHKSSGEQELVVIDIKKLKEKKEFSFFLISNKGEPENPSWNSNGSILLWNASINGVSNIFSYNVVRSEITALTNTLKGLFKPVFINEDSIFAFEFSTEGFYPVKFHNAPAAYIPAIEYLGQRIIQNDKQLTDLVVKYNEPAALPEPNIQSVYNSFSNIKIQTFIPVITGFQNQIAFGFFSQLADPLINHDIITEVAYSPFDDAKLGPKFHVKLKYDYLKKYEFGIDYNSPDFYDLFNKRKRGTIGTKVRLGYIYYWLYDNPRKIVQKTEAAVYHGIKYINDNLIAVSEPDFVVAQTSWNSKNLRKTIGSSDFEHGDEFNITLMGFGTDPDEPAFAGQLFAEWDSYSLWLFNHNVFHFKLAAGYNVENEKLTQSRFYFGGFGNRLIDNIDVKQFRSVFRFPGIPIYSLTADKFIKFLLENNFAPIRFNNISLGQHLFNHIDFSVYSQLLLVEPEINGFYADVGVQLNLVLKHWYNLESTLSFGVAQAWSDNFKTPDTDGFKSPEWFFSIKLLKN